MRIGIDGRLINETGVGRYIRNLIAQLALTDKTNSYVVFVRDDGWKPPNKRWVRRIVSAPWHSVAEQFIMPWIFLKSRLDLVHIPYFNVPVLYPGKFVVTIHDLTILHFDTGKATTLPLVLYTLRRLGYYITLAVGLRRATRVIAVSNTTKQEIIDHFHIPSEKIIVTYEGVDNKFQIKKRIIKNPYFLYVGNAYPHKNLESLLRAFQKNSGKLVLVGKEDYFYRKIKEFAHSLVLDGRVVFFGEANDKQLASLYTHAIALVFPSLMEGFGLPGLEAMAVGTPVVCSDIPVFHEIYGDSAQYFDPENSEDINTKLNKILSENMLRKRLIEAGKNRIHAYSWRTMAQKTLRIYNHRTGTT